MRVLCIGAGAIGLLAGGSAATQGAAVTFLVKPGQESKLAGREIHIQNQTQNWQVSDFNVISSLTDLDRDEVFDAIFIAVKTFDTESVISQLEKAKVNFRSILCLQNGVENEDKFRIAFPRAEIVAASVVSAVSRLDDTSIRVEKNRGIGLSGKDEYVQPVFAILKNAGLKPQIFADMRSMKWSKMLSNLFSNAASGILDMSPNEVYSHKDLFRIEKAQILETASVMRRSGLKIENLPGLPLRPLIMLMRITPDVLLQPLLKKMVAGGRGEKMPSFYIEKMKGSSRSEVNDLNGAVVRKGEALGVPTPINRALTETFNLILKDAKARQAFSRHPEKLVETTAAVNRIQYDEINDKELMTEKIPFQNRIIALFLSLVIVAGLFLSLFALPVELIFFNPQSYSTVFQSDDYTPALPGILSEVLVYQSAQSGVAPQFDLIKYKDIVSPILANHISAETVQNTFDSAINQTFSYLNFKIPTSDMKINIADVKSELSTNSAEIASEFLAALPNCTDNELASLDTAAISSAAGLPACKPGSKELAFFKQMWTKTFEDTFNSLPSSVALTAVMPMEETLTDQNFFNYSLVRWGFRLLPVVSIILLILLAALLRKQRKVMWKWTGWLLLIVSGITLIGLVILLIGFDQFIAMVLNPHLKNLVTGFGYILLGAVQEVGYQMLIWVIISTAIMLAFGLMLILAGRMVKEPQPVAAEKPQYETIESEPVVEEIEPQKAVVPETMEEIEQREKDAEDGQAEA